MKNLLTFLTLAVALCVGSLHAAAVDHNDTALESVSVKSANIITIADPSTTLE